MSPRTFLVLGRVSNLPTVWTNALAAFALAGLTSLSSGGVAMVLAVLTLAYVGGMYLNDAFDAEIDAAERSNRPIPTGQISSKSVFVLGFAMLGAGVLLALPLGMTVVLATLGLAASVLLYDWLHKKTVLAPMIMGACRFFCYVVAAEAADGIDMLVLVGAAGLFAHTVGLTYAAKQEAYDRVERLWPLGVMAVPVVIGAMFAFQQLPSPAVPQAAFPILCWLGYTAWTVLALRRFVRRAAGDVPKGVVSLIAGMALYDAVMLASMGTTIGAVIALVFFALTLLLQRVVPGT